MWSTLLYTIKNEFLQVSAADHGEELQSIRTADGAEYLWQGDARYWADRALNIFPYIARLTNGSYYLDGQLYHMDIHGLSPYQTFAAEAAGDRMTFVLDSSDATLARYPRAFRFTVAYRLEGRTLEVVFQVENRDRRTMYFAVGGHPGFNVPLEAGRSFTDYRIRFPEAAAPEQVGFTAKCFLDGTSSPYPLDGSRAIPLRHDLFDNDAIVLQNAGHQAILEPIDGAGRTVTVTYPGMEYLGLWHAVKTDAPYVCIEPWTSLPSTQDKIAVLEEQKDLLTLEPGGCYRNVWTIEIR